MSDVATVTPAMASVGFSFDDVTGFAQHLVNLIQEKGDLVVDTVRRGVKLIQLATGRSYIAIWAELNQEIVNVAALVAAFKAEFNL